MPLLSLFCGYASRDICYNYIAWAAVCIIFYWFGNCVLFWTSQTGHLNKWL